MEETVITIKHIVWVQTGLTAYEIYAVTVNKETGEMTGGVLDYHWEEYLAWKCANSWQRRLGGKIKVV